MRSIISILLIVLFSLTTATGQVKQPLFHTVDENDGLLSDIIQSVEVDDYGYIWIGCLSGLCRYDGQTFNVLSATGENTKNVVNGISVADILKDKKARVWIATEKGVSFYDCKVNKFTYVPMLTLNDNKKHISFQADKLYMSSKGDVYYYSTYNELHIFRESDSTFVPVFHDIFNNNTKIRYVHMDSNDNFWLLSEESHKIYKVDPLGDIIRTIDCDKYDIPTPTKGNYDMLDNGNGEIWFGGDNGLVIYDQNSDRFHKLDTPDNGLYPAYFYPTKCFHKDKHGLIWIGTNAMELYVYDPQDKQVTQIPSASAFSPYRLNSPTVIDIAEDSRGLMWFGTWKGLSYAEVNPTKKFHNVSSDETDILPNCGYISTFASRGSLVAIGSDGGGVTFWHRGTPKNIAVFDPALSNNTKMERGSVLGSAFDKEGYYYNGGYGRSVTRIHPNLKDVDLYKVDPNSPTAMTCDFTASIICAPDDTIWILTNGGGLYKLKDKDKGIFETHNTDRNGNSIVSVWGTCLASFGCDTLLLGSYQGISVYDAKNNIYKTYSCDIEDSTSLSHNWVSYILVDSKRRIWIGTSFGLNLFDIKTGKFKHIGLRNGFVSEMIKGVLEDTNTGKLWVSTAKGISRFNPESMLVERTYLASDGLLSENFTTRACLKDSDGTMYFGNANGFTYFNPSEISDNWQLPMPTITGLMINYNRVTPLDKDSPLRKAPEATDMIELNSNQSTFTIEFASLNFVNEGGNKYFYTLSGYNDEWVSIGTRHEITFTNLDPGNYLFKVKCQNSDGCESEERPLRIIVHPPFYKTWWFVTLEVLFVFGIAALYYLMRLRSLKENQKKLEEMVKTRTEALVSANNELETQKDEILRQSQQLSKSLNNTLVLNDISRNITSSFDIDNIIITAYSHVMQLVKVDFFTVGIYSHGLNALEFNHIFCNGKQSGTDQIKYDNKECMEIKCIGYDSEMYLTGEECTKMYFWQTNSEQLGTAILFTIHDSNTANGVLIVGCSEQTAYSEADVANLRMVGTYVSIAIDKARDYQQLRTKNNAINGSIRYAKTIQDAILVPESTINRHFDGMVIFRPKDIVSGDFYWFRTIGADPEHPEVIFAADIDCTGHGVPGAFMSLISNTLLNDIIMRSGYRDTAQILKMLDHEIVMSLNQQNSENSDGLDMAICRFDMNPDGSIRQVSYSGAKNPLYYYSVKTDELSMIGADRISIGGFNVDVDKQFTSHTFPVERGDMFFMSSDGIVDQNNKERKRFGKARLVKIIQQSKEENMQDIKMAIEKSLDTFMSGEEQRDDISVMGLRARI